MPKTKTIRTIELAHSFLDPDFLVFFKNEVKVLHDSHPHLNPYHLEIHLSNQDFTESTLSSLPHPFHASSTLDLLETTKQFLCHQINQMIDVLERTIFVRDVKQIYVWDDAAPGTVVLKFCPTALLEDAGILDQLKKIRVSMHPVFSSSPIHQIFDRFVTTDQGFCIDERNRDKTLFNSLLLRYEQGEHLEIDELTDFDWKQLLLKEKIPNTHLAELYQLPMNEFVKIRKKFLPNLKKYADEYYFYFILLYVVREEDLYGNECLPILEIAKQQGIEIIYDYESSTYQELFRVEDEIKHQKQVEQQNLKGADYEIPLIGIFLEKLYQAISSHQLDRKIMKSDYFLNSYHDLILEAFLERTDKSGLRQLYQTGEIYHHPNFIPYQALYKRMGIPLNEPTSPLTLLKTPSTHPSNPQRRTKRVVSPRDYVALEQEKIEVGNAGQELVFQYEYEKLADYPHLQKQIERNYLTDEGCGYDITSYHPDGTKIYIEVKTKKKASNTRITFLISDKENKFLETNPNAYLYYISDLKDPKLRIISHEEYLTYEKKEKQYLIDQIIEEKERTLTQ